jgi:hypothetical protein
MLGFVPDEMEHLRKEKEGKTDKRGATLEDRFDDRGHPSERHALMEILWFPLIDR